MFLYDLIAKRIESLPDVEQQEQLKNMMELLLVPLFEHSQKQYQELEKRIVQEIPIAQERYTIYSSVLTKGNTQHAFLRPVANMPVYLDLQALLDNSENVFTPIKTVFLEEDAKRIAGLLNDAQRMKARIVTSEGVISGICEFRPAERYKKELIKLHRLFVQNGIPWCTVNTAYIEKFLDICLIDIQGEPVSKSKAKIESIEIDMNSIQIKCRDDVEPVWNVDMHNVKADDFPMPAQDKVNYEYRFSTRKLGSSHGFLVDMESAPLSSVRYERDEIVVVSDRERNLKWDVIRVLEKKERIAEAPAYPMLTNAQQYSLMDRLVQQSGSGIKTKAELNRIVQSFDLGQYLEFVDVAIVGSHVRGDTYSMNWFIVDEIRDPSAKKSMLLKFKRLQDSFISIDILSFVVSQIQILFPEYKCEGVYV